MLFLTGFLTASQMSYAISNEVIVETEESAVLIQDDVTAEASFTQELKTRFIEGGPSFMGIVLICLILGLAIAIERIIYARLRNIWNRKRSWGSGS